MGIDDDEQKRTWLDLTHRDTGRTNPLQKLYRGSTLRGKRDGKDRLMCSVDVFRWKF